MFKPLHKPGQKTVSLSIDGEVVQVAEGLSVAAAVLMTGLNHCRTTGISEAPRAPYCMMGLCFDCLMEIDGVANCQACLTPVREGMKVARQSGLRAVVK